VLVTGHTGFKGAWLSLWLHALGAELTGVGAAPPSRPSMYELARVGEGVSERRLDIRDADALSAALTAADPEIVLHLAAQPLVRRSLRDPATTYAVNVMGTVNVLEAVRRAGSSVRAVVVVTSDKCYANDPPGRRLTEQDPLGGRDPYSSSKAGAELVAAAYRESFFSGDGAPRLATARAGNVIGGGDWGEDRLLADSVRAVETHSPLRIRNPNAVRPWQHVLNPLSGYLRLARELHGGGDVASAWNFGPADGDARTVGWIVGRLGELWDGALDWELDDRANPPEAAHLELDSSRAERELGWRAALNLEEALGLVVAWHRARIDGADMRAVSLEQIAVFSQAAAAT